MLSIVEELKKLATKLTDAETVDDVDGTSIAEIIKYIADNYSGGD